LDMALDKLLRSHFKVGTNPKTWYYLGLAFYERGIKVADPSCDDFTHALFHLTTFLKFARSNSEVSIRIAGSIFFRHVLRINAPNNLKTGKLYFEKIYRKDPPMALSLIEHVKAFITNLKRNINGKLVDVDSGKLEEITHGFSNLWSSLSIPKNSLKTWSTFKNSELKISVDT